MKPLSSKQQAIIEYIQSFTEDRGYPPTVREIGKAVGLSSSASVHSQLNKLEQRGYITKDRASSRAISVVKEERTQYIEVPMLGKVTAGNPIEAIDDINDYFQIPLSMIKGNDPVFMLTVSGDSMKNVGIMDGDQIIVRKSNTARNGEIVVALTSDNEATVKRFFKEDGYIRLQPENEDYDPIILNDVTIVGKVIGLFRDVM